MNCDGVRELLSAYVDGELSSGELLRVEQHLRRCPVCAEEVDALRQAIALVGALEEVELPAGFREGLRARLAKVSPQLQPIAPVTPIRPAWQRQARRWALPAAAVAAFALATSGVYGQLGPILTRVADSNPPAGSVQIPPVESVTPPPKDNPTEVAQGGGETPAGPGNAGSGESVTTPPVDTPPPAPPAGGKDPVKDPDPAPVIDWTNGPTRVASYVDQVTPPAKLPSQMANQTTVQAIVPDPGASCTALKSTFGAAECSTKDAGRVVEVRFQVPLEKAGDALGQVTSVTGGTVNTPDGIDRAPQLKALLEQLITIDEDLVKLALAVDTAKDPAQREIEEERLARRQDDGEKAKADYNRLSDEVASHLFVIDLQKQGQ